ncbi:DASH complex subunit dad1 domain-containing protein [Purpureocillium lavendulum]|uniref:DASH complex subunit DAD1 n=1 Tax=Purpureocillium lavendulum TaxID=1247861 RepID=A0AB34FLR8_9HYPO|nr:DASH complex subunit dad1 domain-containing protein [Purpureocillium lavendulum]
MASPSQSPSRTMASSHQRSASVMDTAGPTTRGDNKSYFEQHREALIGDIAMSFEHVLANINKLNRSLEAVIAVGNEFSSVEALWSQFENVMAKDEDGDNNGRQGEQQGHGQGQEQQQQ